MNHLSFMSANFVARELGYNMPEGWLQGDAATQAHFSPLNTFEERFDALLGEIVDLGFEAIDLWTGHLNWKWATPAHLDTAKGLLDKHGLRVVSYAGGFGETPAEFEAACLICRKLGIPILGGGTSLLESDRDAAVAILRKHGVIFALENHPEANAEEVLAKLGDGDEDVIGVAVDTGWFATQEADVFKELQALGNRIRHVHLKDVLAKRTEKTGYFFKDMGHETCELGKGIVPVKECIQYLVTQGYRGAIAIEHEPEDFDPRDDCRKSLESVKGWFVEATTAITPKDPVGVAIVGCGNIADRYAAQINSYPHVKLLGTQDIDRSRAEKLATDFSGKVYDSIEELLADDAVEVVVNLTIHHVHEAIIRQCLEAGKHVHTEKPLALNSEAAWGLVELADQLGLRLSSAPTTWLGEAQQAVWRKIKEGAIGQPRIAYAEVNWGRIESWHPNPGPFYAVGPVFDVAVYPLTLLTAFFGPVKRVIAGGGVLYPDRLTKEGKPFTVESPDWTAAVVEFASGMTARVTASFYVTGTTTQSGMEIHGDNGMVRMDRWDVFESPAYVASKETGDQTWKLVPDSYPAPGIEFARGLSDLAHAIRENRPHLTTGAHAAHVVEIAEAILTSIRESRPVEVDATRFRPAELA
ncbi:MAG: Gfo/Idh/MocA family oxidoreductase [Puniceicoccaceae bacterium]